MRKVLKSSYHCAVEVPKVKQSNPAPPTRSDALAKAINKYYLDCDEEAVGEG